MDGADLAFDGVVRQAELIRAGEVSSRELVELYLERIQRIEPEINAFRVVMAERALGEADQADSRLAGGEERPLLGVPIAVKDNVDVAGEITTHGTGAHGPPATSDAEVVRRLRGAGAVLIGKTNLPELAIIGSTESPNWGVTRNPWDPERAPGGSSGGSAAAVASGLAAAAHASDGAGSIRIPASSCGLFGLKPQRGRVSLMPEAQHWHGMSVFGCLTRTVADTGLLLDVMSGRADGDAHTPDPPARPFAASARELPGKLRVAFSLRPLLPVPISGEVRGAVHETCEVLRSLGHDVAEVNPPWGDLGGVFLPRFLAGIADDADTMPRPHRLQRRTRGFARMGRAIPGPVLDRAMRDEARQAKRINRLFDDHDVLMTPITTRTQVRAAEWEGMGAFRTLIGMLRVYPFTVPWNATGQPAASVPAGFTADGLPLAVQLVGRPNDEGTLLSVAAQLESERPWADRRPPVS